ncbi:MAG TPA: hypothetical protein VGO47_08705 [Chlamydiales bacterium]|nr:hypothetical protein [Chlamydiales bacterium]
MARIYCDHETTEAFEQIWTAFFEVLEEVTGKPLKIKVLHGEGNFFAFLVDGDAGQAVGLSHSLMKMNNPQVSGISPEDPRNILPYVLKTCWTHCSKSGRFC